MGMCDAMCQCDDCNRHPISGHPMYSPHHITWSASEMKDPVTNPIHYTKGIECWDYIASHHMNYNQGCMIKYATRYLLKDNPVQDLKKVIAYAEKEIKILEARE